MQTVTEFGLAAEAEMPALVELLDVLFSQEEEFQPDHAAQQRGLAAIMADPAVGHVLVARQAERVVAMVGLLYTISTALGARVALLEDMVVHPSVRGQGIGSGLLQYAADFARQQGCRRITLLTDASNQQAQRFYRRLGFTASTMVPFRLRLNPG